MQKLKTTTVPLWPKKAPGAKGKAIDDIPTLEIFLPDPEIATGAAIIVMPGGGYVGHAEHEGAPVAQWLAAQGITGFVLRYRLAWTYQHPIPFIDAKRSIRYVRAHASDWNLDPERIGVLGFSAGGHLVSMTATHIEEGNPNDKDPVERVSARPNAQILVYPVITLSPNFGVWWNILGDNPPHEIIHMFCTERHVNAQTPPAFLAHCIHDVGVPVMNSDLYAAALKRAGIPYEYVREHLGDHGYGLVDRWGVPCVKWLRTLGYAAPERPE
ncbi:endo-1,4-beta-xylanase [Dictyobacter alpinus]|uniref:Endo-1,4-beta-xylanase n=1 Tax=Dictyobacter alpinus TaxID=2014873 RepID=A0A402BE90_9CHLR|nr:alpha/beta hydrolase [Dictyobacter alpinus]GCE29685.1 endo-1,4-beta-xylanase [Dictyobacter alpinus]